jgi:protein TonB
MRRSVEILGFIGVSAAVHAGVVTGLGDGFGGPQGQGAEGRSQATLQAAPESLAALAERWSTAPETIPAPQALQTPEMASATPDIRPETAVQSLPRPDLPTPVATEAAPARGQVAPPPTWADPALGGQAPSLPPVTAPTLSAPSAQVDAAPRGSAPPMLAQPTRAESAPTTDTAEPPAPGGTELAAAQSPRPPERPEGLAPPPRQAAPQPAAPSTPQPARVASGQGGGATQGSAPAPAPAQPALSAGQRQSLMSHWGAQIMARIERARPRVQGSGQVTLALQIARDGRLAGLSVARSSGNAELDRAALSAVQRAGRFPAAPAGLSEASYGFSLPIRFR